jgi:hypothetical protein
VVVIHPYNSNHERTPCTQGVVRSRDADCPVPRRQLVTPSAWNSKLIQALGAGLELKLGEVITEVFKPEGKEIFAIHVRGTYADHDTIGSHREIPSRIAEKGSVRI